MSLCSLSDEIIRDIFSHLDPAQLCLSGRACSRFYRITRDPHFWRKVHLNRPLSVARMKLFIRRCKRLDLMEDLSILGYMIPEFIRKPRWKEAILTPAILKDLGLKCNALKSVRIESAKIGGPIKVEMLPLIMERLEINKCEFPDTFLRSLSFHSTLPNLSHLHFSDCVCISGHSPATKSALGARIKRLRTLTMRNCPNYSENNLESLLRHSFVLTKLDLSNNPSTVSDRVVVLIGLSCKQLNYLSLADCTKITSKGLKGMALAYPAESSRLEYLNLSGCPNVTNSCVKDICRLKQLKLLDLRRTGCNNLTDFDWLAPLLPELTIKCDLGVFPDPDLNLDRSSAISRSTISLKRKSSTKSSMDLRSSVSPRKRKRAD